MSAPAEQRGWRTANDERHEQAMSNDNEWLRWYLTAEAQAHLGRYPLTDQQRRIISARLAYPGLGYMRLASKLGLSKSAVTSALFRLRARAQRLRNAS